MYKFLNTQVFYEQIDEHIAERDSGRTRDGREIPPTRVTLDQKFAHASLLLLSKVVFILYMFIAAHTGLFFFRHAWGSFSKRIVSPWQPHARHVYNIYNTYI